jgi:hypothetical protein
MPLGGCQAVLLQVEAVVGAAVGVSVFLEHIAGVQPLQCLW